MTAGRSPSCHERRRRKVFLITGASTGIGEATARGAPGAGYKVVVAARSTDKLEALASEIGGLAVTCDVSKWPDQEALVNRTLDEYGRLDVALANAGYMVRERGFKGETPESWKDMILTNFYGVALTIRACFDPLVEAKGHLLVSGSLVGRLVTPGSVYSATKFAIHALAESARQELHGTGVRVTLIEPGIVSTPFYDQPWEGMLEADDIARAVMYAVSQPPHVDVNDVLVRLTAQQVQLSGASVQLDPGSARRTRIVRGVMAPAPMGPYNEQKTPGSLLPRACGRGGEPSAAAYPLMWASSRSRSPRSNGAR